MATGKLECRYHSVVKMTVTTVATGKLECRYYSVMRMNVTNVATKIMVEYWYGSVTRLDINTLVTGRTVGYSSRSMDIGTTV